MILVLQGVIILAIVSAKMYLNNAYAQETGGQVLRSHQAVGRPS